MKKILFVINLLALLPFYGKGQSNELIRFDTRTQQITQLPAVPISPSVPAARSGHSFGCLGPATTGVLPQNNPTTNTLPGTQFARRVRAASRFEGLSFPGRTAVSLAIGHNGARSFWASGTLVGERFVLTAAHNVVGFLGTGPGFTGDSLLVEPAFDNGRQSSLPTAWAYRFYVPAKFYQSWDLDYDVAIIELSKPIGRSGGWLGFGYDTDTTLVRNNVWHKFSYPGQDVFVTPSRYNGDTLFYEYGRALPNPQSTSIRVPNHAGGIPGQSGSAFFRTDNRSYWTVYGVLSSSNDFVHATISRSYFEAFQKVIRDNPAPLAKLFELYPNPVSNQATLQLPPCTSGAVHVEIVDMQGRTVRQYNFPSAGTDIALDLSGLLSGLYVLRAQAGAEKLVRRFIKIE